MINAISPLNLSSRVIYQNGNADDTNRGCHDTGYVAKYARTNVSTPSRRHMRCNYFSNGKIQFCRDLNYFHGYCILSMRDMGQEMAAITKTEPKLPFMKLAYFTSEVVLFTS